jgi:hypothetical protein
MPVATGSGRRSADRDVRAGAAGGITRQEQDRRQAQRSEDEADR